MSFCEQKKTNKQLSYSVLVYFFILNTIIISDLECIIILREPHHFR